jgi:hypothetical protein
VLTFAVLAQSKIRKLNLIFAQPIVGICSTNPTISQIKQLYLIILWASGSLQQVALWVLTDISKELAENSSETSVNARLYLVTNQRSTT